MPAMKDDKLPNRDYVVNVGKQKPTMTIISEHFDSKWTAETNWQSEAGKWREIHSKEELVDESPPWISKNVCWDQRGIK